MIFLSSHHALDCGMEASTLEEGLGLWFGAFPNPEVKNKTTIWVCDGIGYRIRPSHSMQEPQTQKQQKHIGTEHLPQPNSATRLYQSQTHAGTPVALYESNTRTSTDTAYFTSEPRTS